MSRSQPHQHDSDHRPGCVPGECDYFWTDPTGDVIGECHSRCYHFLVINSDDEELDYCLRHGTLIAERMGTVVWRGDDPVYDPPDEPFDCPTKVYFMRRHDGMIKIGWSKNPAKRMKDLQTGAGALEIIHTEPGGRIRERRLHDRFASDRVAGEWFTESDAIREYLAYEGPQRAVVSDH